MSAPSPLPPPVVQQPQLPVVHQVVLSGGCERGGVCEFTEVQPTCCGLTLAVLCFPIGILCCLAMMEKSCKKCGRVQK